MDMSKVVATLSKKIQKLQTENNSLTSKVERLTLELERLKRGDFTEEEFQNLCHNFSEEDKVSFFRGCTEFQKKLFGCSAVDEAVKATLGSSLDGSIIP